MTRISMWKGAVCVCKRGAGTLMGWEGKGKEGKGRGERSLSFSISKLFNQLSRSQSGSLFKFDFKATICSPYNILKLSNCMVSICP